MAVTTEMQPIVRLGRFCAAGAFAVLTACGGPHMSRQTDALLASDAMLAGQLQPQPPSSPAQAAPTATQQAAPTVASDHRTQTAARTAHTKSAPEAEPSAPPQTSTLPFGGPVPVPRIEIMAPPPGTPSISRGIPEGTKIPLVTGARVCTSSSQRGDRFIATVSSQVLGVGGAVIPTTAPVVIELTAVNPDSGTITLVARTIAVASSVQLVAGTLQVDQPLQLVPIAGRAGDNRDRAITTAVAKDIIAGIVGSDTTAAHRTAVAAKSDQAQPGYLGGDYQSCLPKGAAITLTLIHPLAI